MAGETPITIVGNVTADPTVREVGDRSVINFTVASTPRQYNRQTEEWEDGPTSFYRVAMWNQGQSVANLQASIAKGSRVVVVGTLRIRQYEDNEQNPRTSVDVTADEVGVSARFAVVTAEKSGKGRTQSSPVDPAFDDAPAESEAPAEKPAAKAPAKRASAAKPKAGASAVADMFA